MFRFKNQIPSVVDIIGELKECVNKYHIKSFLFRSDTFTADKAWLTELCHQIKTELPGISWACNSRVDLFNEDIAKKMKDAGCWLIAFGIESGDQKILDRIQKGIKLEQAVKALDICRKTALKSSIYLLLGLPWDTPETIQKSISFTQRLNPDFAEFFYVYPFPGSDLYEEMVQIKLVHKKCFPEKAYQEPAFSIPG